MIRGSIVESRRALLAWVDRLPARVAEEFEVGRRGGETGGLDGEEAAMSALTGGGGGTTTSFLGGWRGIEFER